MTRWFAVLAVLSLVALAACGSGSGSGSAARGSARAEVTVKPEPAGVNPSVSARMVCTTEAQAELAQSLGATPTQVTTPTWADHLYSCTYVYPTGSITLSVKELDSAAQTTQYFDALGTLLGRRPDRIAIAQGAFLTTNGSMVVRKDWKVLDVDVSKLPPQFGTPPQVPSDVAVSTAATILGCWSGA